MKLFAVLLLALAALNIRAEGGAPDPVGTFLSRASLEKTKCTITHLNIDLEADTARMGGTLVPVERYLQADKCAREAQQTVRPYFDSAKAAKPELAGLLIDYYADWVQLMKENTPRPGESKRAREQRIAPLQTNLSKLETKIDLSR